MGERDTLLIWLREQVKTGRLFFFRLLMVCCIVFYFPLVLNHQSEQGVKESAQESAVLSIDENGMGGVSLTPLDLTDGDYTAILANVAVGDSSDLGVSVLQESPDYFRPRMLNYSSYKVVGGDTVSGIAAWAGLREDTLLSVNKIKNSRLLQIGQVLKIPNQDGIYHTVAGGETLESIGGKYKVDEKNIAVVNELFSDAVKAGSTLFIPGARMDWVYKQEINGDLFIWPVAGGYITSNFGHRSNPFGGGGRQFHTGLDIGAPTGTAVKAAMGGRVSTVAYDGVLGNYIVISHHSGYRTIYGHLSATRVKPGTNVHMGQRIGDVGSTGLSTGPHLHFTVYKNGVLVNPRSLMK